MTWIPSGAHAPQWHFHPSRRSRHRHWWRAYPRRRMARSQLRFQCQRLSRVQGHLEKKTGGCHCSQLCLRCDFRGRSGGPTNQEFGGPLAGVVVAVAAGLADQYSPCHYPRASCYLCADGHHSASPSPLPLVPGWGSPCSAFMGAPVG